MLNMVNGSLQSELNRFFQVLHDSPATLDSVSSAAFCKARKKFSHTAFKSLNNCLVETFYEGADIKRWKGFRLLAVDGSTVQIPESPILFEHFGKAREKAHNPSVRVSQLYDVKNKISIDVQVDLPNKSERDLAAKHLELASSNDLVLYDRGYPATWLFSLHKLKGVNFCARAINTSSNVLKNFLESGELDRTTSFPCVEKSLRRCRKDGLPMEPVPVRLVRIELPKGQTEILITSLLDQKKYPHEIFKDLYHQRWGIEEDYKLMKSRLDLENFSGQSVESVFQDIHAKILTKNVSAVAMFEAEPLKENRCKNRKWQYKINSTHALSQIKDNVVRFLLGTWPPQLRKMMIIKISMVVDAYRPERKYSRVKKRQNWKKYTMAYKRTG